MYTVLASNSFISITIYFIWIPSFCGPFLTSWGHKFALKISIYLHPSTMISNVALSGQIMTMPLNVCSKCIIFGKKQIFQQLGMDFNQHLPERAHLYTNIDGIYQCTWFTCSKKCILPKTPRRIHSQMWYTVLLLNINQVTQVTIRSHLTSSFDPCTSIK